MDIRHGSLKNLLQEMDETFTSITGQTISFVDQKGQWQEPLHLDNFTAFCRQVVESELGSSRCQSCNHQFGQAEGGINIRRCHMGVSVISVPVPTEEGRFTLSYGQFLTQDTLEEFNRLLEQNCRELHLDYPTMKGLADTLRVLSEEELEARTQLLHVFASYISISAAKLRIGLDYAREIERKLELERNMRNMEFKFLQSQISPHFLFNTLNLLMRSAYQENAEHTAELICNLSDLLRRAYHPKDSICTLQEEVICVQKYLELQHQRLGPDLSFSVSCQPDCEQFMLPVLTIQPLAENAIVHGLGLEERPMHIDLSVQRQGDELVIVIADDGGGMPAPLVKQLNEGNYEGSGLGNVSDRLKLFFGKAASMHISSSLDTGTKVELRCPIQETGGKER